MPWVVGTGLLVNLQLEEYSAESIPSTHNMMTLQGTVRELRNNTENGTIKEVEERAYGDNVNIYVYNNITRTPPWTDNAIPIHNHDGAGYSYISSPPARYGNFLSTEMLEAKTIFSLPWANSICTHTQQCLHTRLHRHASLHMIVGHVQI